MLSLRWKLQESIGPATCCDVAHLRWDVHKTLPCIKIACDGLRCIFEHVGNLAPDFGIFQLFTFRFPRDFQQNKGNLIYFLVIND